MRTLGIDLASQDRRTAMCAIDWRGGRALVELPQIEVSDDDALDAMHDAEAVGIDAPFGWPDAAVEAIHAFAARGRWPPQPTNLDLRFRLTDRFVHEAVEEHCGKSLWPLSVSSDRIALCAWRCARLLTAYFDEEGASLDRLEGPLAEVYPAAALLMWDFDRDGYKSNGGTARKAEQRAARESLVQHLEERGPWLVLSDDVRERCADSDDALDALLAALVARARHGGQTLEPPYEYRAQASREGWIHIPARDSFMELGAGA